MKRETCAAISRHSVKYSVKLLNLQEKQKPILHSLTLRHNLKSIMRTCADGGHWNLR